mmetsp:Transcript_55340/g.160635  ORF Transcript_55340/g.160635 Transcript_55340/m.160635 type:complete len:261 (-) Transcript_55340:245-1027(-)
MGRPRRPSLLLLLFAVVAFALPLREGDPHALAPDSTPLFSLSGPEHALAVLLAVLPLAFELPAVGPSEGAFALFQVVDILALVHFGVLLWALLVGPFVLALAVHAVVDPLACVFPAVNPSESTLTFDVVVAELALIGGAFGPPEGALAMLLPVEVRAAVLGLVLPNLNSLSMLQVVLPLALVARLLRSVHTHAVGLALLPLAFVPVTIGVGELPLAVLLPISHFPLVVGAVREGLRHLTLLLALAEVLLTNGGRDAGGKR